MCSLVVFDVAIEARAFTHLCPLKDGFSMMLIVLVLRFKCLILIVCMSFANHAAVYLSNLNSVLAYRYTNSCSIDAHARVRTQARTPIHMRHKIEKKKKHTHLLTVCLIVYFNWMLVR